MPLSNLLKQILDAATLRCWQRERTAITSTPYSSTVPQVGLDVDLSEFDVRICFFDALVFLSLRGTRPAGLLREEDYFGHSGWYGIVVLAHCCLLSKSVPAPDFGFEGIL